MTKLLPTHSIRNRVAATAGLLLATTLAATTPASPVRSQTTPLGACILRPSADSMPSASMILDAWRVHDGVSEILHDVRCSDGRFDRMWIPADII